MRLAPAAALLLPVLLPAAQAQSIPSSLTSLWDSISPYLPGYVNPYNTTSPTSSARTKTIVPLTAQNWAPELNARASEPWLILITGGNKTCGVHNDSCAAIDAAWATASTSARTDSRAPNLGYVDCETNRLLCATWGAFPATVWWVQPEVRTVRRADTTAARVTARGVETEGEVPLDIPSAVDMSREVWIVALNKTSVTPEDITGLYRKGEWKTKGSELSGEEIVSRHPFNGKLAKWGLNVPVGYVFFLIGMFPSWTTIMMLSFTARMFLNRQKAPAETPAQKAERERKGKYQDNGKVKGSPPGDGTNAGRL